MECRQAEELLVAHARGELSPTETAELERHLATCPNCRWNADAARKTLEILEAAGEPDIVGIVRDVLAEACTSGASDVHFEPGRETARIRLRVDGVLRDIRTVASRDYPAVVARLHVIGGSNPFEARVPQFSRVEIRCGEKQYDLRGTHLPSCRGPHVTFRVLPSDTDVVSLGEMGMSATNLDAVRSLLHQPCGLVALAGPMGSGKTTTAYACLKDITHPGVAVFTIEDPVAMLIDGTTQLHLNHRQGMGYPSALKAVMRADPDVVFVGETADGPTAAAVCDLALTGHLVLTCVHGDDAASAVIRLQETGVLPYTLSTALVGVVSQRLVRRICAECKEEYSLPAEEIAFLHRAGVGDVPLSLWRGRGCEHCRSTGYRGRVAINEVLTMNRGIADAIAEGRYTPDLGRSAVPISMVRDAADKAVAGVTTVQEARRVTSGL